jgi:hypothetical protein
MITTATTTATTTVKKHIPGSVSNDEKRPLLAPLLLGVEATVEDSLTTIHRLPSFSEDGVDILQVSQDFE